MVQGNRTRKVAELLFELTYHAPEICTYLLVSSVIVLAKEKAGESEMSPAGLV